MSDAPYLAGAAALSWLGMAWLALAMEAHWEQVMTHRLPRTSSTAMAGARNARRAAGLASLAGAMGACLLADHPLMAVLVWLMLLSGSALSVAMVLAYRPTLLSRL
jgi:hypothetical protein